jgi:hypothetical protein
MQAADAGFILGVRAWKQARSLPSQLAAAVKIRLRTIRSILLASDVASLCLQVVSINQEPVRAVARAVPGGFPGTLPGTVHHIDLINELSRHPEHHPFFGLP